MAENLNRFKNYFLCVNKGAECFDKLADIIKAQNNCSYAYILHNKDRDVNKPLHYHVVLCYENARSWNSIQKTFKGSHIEVCEFVKSSVQYLIHLNNPEKEPYTISEIICNMPLDMYFSDNFEPFDPNLILEYYKQGTSNFLMFYKRFGAQISKHQTLLKNVLEECRKNMVLIEMQEARKIEMQELQEMFNRNYKGVPQED